MKLSIYLSVISLMFVFIFSNRSFSQENINLIIDDKEPKIFSPSNGYLKIHTYVDKIYDDGMTKYIYRYYKIFNETGKLIMVVNRSLEEPAIVKLPQGIYIVHAETGTGNFEKFKVIIEGGKITEVEKEEWIKQK